MSNPLNKSRQQKFIGGNPLYNFGGWVPQIEFGSPIKSYIFQAYGGSGGTPTNDSGFYKGNAYGVFQQTSNPLQEINDFSWNGNMYVGVGLNSEIPPSSVYPLIMYSNDATTWLTASTPTLDTFGYFVDVYWDGYKFIASKQVSSASTGDNKSVFWYSADGITWSGDTTNYDRLTATTSSTGFITRDIINDPSSPSNLRKNYLAVFGAGTYKIPVSNDYGISWSAETFTDITGGTPNSLWFATGDNGKLIGSRYFPATASTPSFAEIYYNTIPAVSTGWTRTDAHLSLSDAYSVRGFYVDGTDYYALCNSSTGTSTTRILKSSASNLGNWTIHYSLTGSYFQLTKIADEFYLVGSQEILRGNFDIGFQEIPFDTSLLINSYILPIGDNNT